MKSRVLHPNEQKQLGIAVGVACLPHLLQQPWWLALSLAIILLGLSTLSADIRLKIPRYLGLILGAGVCFLVFQAYQTLVGREGGVAILMALTIVKLIETRTLRDARALILLLFLLTGVAFLHGQEPWQALYALSASVIVLFTAQAVEHPNLNLGINLKTSSRLVLEGIPIALVLFLLFPRLPGPLWAIPNQESATSGLSGEQMTPGSIGNLIQDDSTAFRVSFKDKAPPVSQMYWRGPVFEHYDGISWQPQWRQNSAAAARQFSAIPQIIGSGARVQYTMTLEPHQQNWLLALDMPITTPSNSQLSNRLQVIATQKVTERTRFDFISQLQWISQNDSREQIETSLQLPPELNPKSHALAQSWQTLAPADRVQAALTWLEKNDFSYTLSPPVLTSRNRVDEFLFQSRQGFCENYASSFAFLMRAAGVPARVVTGYQGGSRNSDYWIIRQADAHAWVEVWLDGKGWQRVDPTFVISPSRINEGLARSVNNAQLPFMLRNDNAWLRQMRLKLDVMVNGWNQWVIGYDQQKQNDFLKKLGIDDLLSSAFLLWLIGSVTITLGGFAAWLLYKNRPPPLDAASVQYQKFITRLHPLQRERSMTPQDFAALACQRFAAHSKKINTITALYLKARYGNDAAALRALQREVASFRARR